MAISISRTARSMRARSTRRSTRYCSSASSTSMDLVSNLSGLPFPKVLFARPGARCLKSVVEEHRPGHGTHAPGNGGYGGCSGLHLFEAHVTHRPAAVSLVDPHIHYHSSLLHVLGADHLPPAQGDDENVCASGYPSQVPRARV